ncbi:MAG: hypothetical protein EOP11_25990 [Proteobacteria bacterium]|nr:MAG: hypothetical protein EOP11_25990 [Pseudomonadota bacterium]
MARLLFFCFLSFYAQTAMGSAPFRLKPLALIFAGPTTDRDSLRDLSALARTKGFAIKRVLPGETTPLLLSQTALYVVPGGEDISAPAEGWAPSELSAIRAYVREGGRYLGFCLGGYWASHERHWPGVIPGFQALDLLPVPVHSYSETKESRIERLRWHNGHYRFGFFQDGPDFGQPTGNEQVFARYDNGTIATAIYRVGAGKVAVSGPHWEAAEDWFDETLPDPDPAHRELARELLAELLKP